MTETHTIRDPFLGKDVEISSKLVDRLRGKYACGPVMPNGEPEFGWREFETPPIQHKAADTIEVLTKALTDLLDVCESIGTFRNGVEHNGIDEGDVYVGGLIDQARDALTCVGGARVP